MQIRHPTNTQDPYTERKKKWVEVPGHITLESNQFTQYSMRSSKLEIPSKYGVKEMDHNA